MKLSSLRYFITIAKLQSYTKASEQLFISQPTLSRTILEMEDELGIKIFVREKNNLHLTEEGLLLFKEASEIVERCDRLPQLFHGENSDSKESAVIKIGYQRSINIEWGYPVFHSFMQENQNCRIILDEIPSTALKQKLEDDACDIVISIEGTLKKMHDVKTARVGNSKLLLVVNEKSPFAGREKVSLKELKEENFILINRRYSAETIDRVIAHCVMNGFSPQAAEYVDTLPEALEQVGMGVGIAFIHSCMVTEGTENQYHVRILELEEDVYEARVVAIWKAERERKCIRELIHIIEESQGDLL